MLLSATPDSWKKKLRAVVVQDDEADACCREIATWDLREMGADGRPVERAGHDFAGDDDGEVPLLGHVLHPLNASSRKGESCIPGPHPLPSPFTMQNSPTCPPQWTASSRSKQLCQASTPPKTMSSSSGVAAAGWPVISRPSSAVKDESCT